MNVRMKKTCFTFGGGSMSMGSETGTIAFPLKSYGMICISFSFGVSSGTLLSAMDLELGLAEWVEDDRMKRRG